jgi:hypothetical protein
MENNMRSNMKWLCLLSCLMAVVALTTKPAAAEGNPGSVLVFPYFEKGTVTSPDTPFNQLPISQFEISVACPKGDLSCTVNAPVTIKLEWVCGDTEELDFCGGVDFTLLTTVNGTIRFDTTGACEPKDDSDTFFHTCGFVPPPPCEEGYLVAWVVNNANLGSIKFDGLVGDSLLRDSSTAVTAYDAIAIQAGTALANGASTNLYKDNQLHFNGVAYQEASGTVIGSLHYDGTETETGGSGITSYTSLVLLTLDTRANNTNNPVNVNLSFYNEIEQLASETAVFFCQGEFETGEWFGLTNSFGYKGLVESTAAYKTALLGVSDKTGPVTLLGLVLTREDGSEGPYDPAREYAYGLYGNSTYLPTAFIP